MAVWGVSWRVMMAAEETGGGISWIMGQEWAGRRQWSGDVYTVGAILRLLAGSCDVWWQSKQRWAKTPSWSSALCKQDLNRCCSVSSHPVLLLLRLRCFPFLFSLMLYAGDYTSHAGARCSDRPTLDWSLFLIPRTFLCSPCTAMYCVVFLPPTHIQLYVS